MLLLLSYWWYYFLAIDGTFFIGLWYYFSAIDRTCFCPKFDPAFRNALASPAPVFKLKIGSNSHFRESATQPQQQQTDKRIEEGFGSIFLLIKSHKLYKRPLWGAWWLPRYLPSENVSLNKFRATEKEAGKGTQWTTSSFDSPPEGSA